MALGSIGTALEASPTRQRRKASSKSLGFRPDIQGLRAFAVLLVVLDHLFHFPSGGFVGVDVFFVISGYLITALLLREMDSTGRISFAAFYARRVKRILPAAVVVLAATVLTAYGVWYLPRANQTMLDGLASMLFVQNWHLIQVGADYLQASTHPSPLQHYWSLSIEEQFYAVWPIALFAILWLLPARKRRTWLPVLIGGGLLLSLAWAAYRTGSAPSAAYFDTMGRGWELLAGAAVASLGTLQKLPNSARSAVSFAGLATIIGSAFLIAPTSAFPFPWAMLPVAGTVAVIAAHPGARNFMTAPLVNPVSQYIGKISYSLYLWHFPVIIFVTAIVGETWFSLAACLVATFVLSDLSYNWIEKPVIRSRFLRTSTADGRKFFTKDLILPVTVAVLLVAMISLQFRGPSWLKDPAQRTSPSQSTNVTAENAPSLEQLQSMVRESVTASSWPATISPSLDTLDARAQGDAMKLVAPGCRNDVSRAAAPLVCEHKGSSDHTVMVVGDSIALSWVPAVEAAYAGQGWNTVAVGYASCPLFDVQAPSVRGDANIQRSCNLSREKMWKVIDDVRPDVLVLSAAQGYLGLMASGATGNDAGREWEAGVTRTLAKAYGSAKSIVILGNPPEGQDPKNCTSKLLGPASCLTTPDEMHKAKAQADSKAVATVGSKARYVASADLLCADGICPAFIGTTAVRTDSTHLTEEAGVLVSGALRELLPK